MLKGAKILERQSWQIVERNGRTSTAQWMHKNKLTKIIFTNNRRLFIGFFHEDGTAEQVDDIMSDSTPEEVAAYIKKQWPFSE